MEIFNLKSFMIIFKCLCGVVTLFMIGYWMKKFQKDEDVSQVQYISMSSMEHVSHPEITICIDKPFLIQAFEETANIFDYMEYLNGDGDHDQKYKNISFANVTINIFEYLEDIVLWKTDDTEDRICCPGESNYNAIELRNSFNGLIAGVFSKCFSIGISPKFGKTVKFMKIGFNQILTQVIEDMQKKGFGRYIVIFTNLRNQVSRYVNKYQEIWQALSNKNMRVAAVMASTEILRRRNKRSDPCNTNWRDYDNILMNEHIDRVGCSNPYLGQNKAICSNATKMKASRYDLNTIRTKSKPCQEMSNIEIQYIERGTNRTSNATFLIIEYSSELKLITQAPSVDLHALIGNIGGYIGLFLGYAVMQMPDLLVALYAHIRNRVVSMAATYNRTNSRAENQVRSVQEVTPRCESIEKVDQNILKAIQESVSKAEQRLLNVMTKKLDATNRRVDDIIVNW